MNISNKSTRFWKIFSVVALVILSHSESQAAGRSVCSGSPTNFAALQNLTTTATGAGTFHSSVTLAGSRGCAYVIETYYTGTASGLLPGYDYAYAQYTFQDGTFFGSTVYNAFTNTANPCSAPFAGPSAIDHGINTMHGQDTIDLYYVDQSGCSGVAANFYNVSILDAYDDSGDIIFDMPSLPADGVSKAHAEVTNPNAFPDGVRQWIITNSIPNDGTSTNEINLGCTINPTSGEITSGKIAGKITVRVYCSDTPDSWIEEDLQVGCASCGTGCTDDSCDLGGSLRIKINAGNTTFGQSAAGFFQIDQSYPSTALSTPAVLKYYSGGLTTNDITVVHSNSIVQKVIAPQISANVVSNSAYQYQIVLYTNSTFSGSPDTTWTFLNPDGATASNRLSVFRVNGGMTNEYDYAWDGTLQGWSLTSEGGSRLEKRYNSTNGVLRTETHLIFDGSSNIKFQETNVYQSFAWGEQQIANTLGGGTNALVTTWSYYTNSADTTNYSRLYQMVTPGGHWERYSYDTNGRVIRQVTQFLDAPVPTSTAQENTNRLTLSYYSTFTGSDNAQQVETYTYAAGNETSENAVVSYGNEVDTYRGLSAGALSTGDWLFSAKLSYVTPPYVGLPMAALAENGTWTFYNYSTSSNGQFRTNSVSTGQAAANNSSSYIVDGTRNVAVLNQAGNLISQQAYDVASGLLTSSATTLATDTHGRATQIQYLDGTTATTVYACCGIESFTDREGITTSYNYDPYTKQVTDVTRAAITTHNDFDAAGNLIQTTRIGTNGSSTTQNVFTYDTASRQTSFTPASNGSGLNQTITYSEYFDANGHKIDTTAYPDGGTRIETYYQDGSLLSVTGTGVHPLQYAYGIDGNGEYTREIKLGVNGETNEFSQGYKDFVGRNYYTWFSVQSGPAPYVFSVFNSSGQLSAQVDRDGIGKLFAYNAKGQEQDMVVDVNTNSQIDYGGADRITRTVSDVTTDNGTTVLRTRVYLWTTNGVDSSNLLSTVETSADGLRSWNILWNNGVGVTNKTVTYYAGSGNRYVTNTAVDGSYTVSYFQNDLLQSVTSKDSAGSQIGQVSYAYDAHGRQYQATDARTGTTTYGFNDADQITTVTTPAPTQITSIYFDAMGRVLKTTLPDSTSVTNEFYLNGDLKRTYGSRTYPVAYGYDSQSRVKTMTNWTSFASGIGARVTKWMYDGYTGFMTNKVYDGNTAGISYTFTGSGKLQTRTWARGITTTYGYNTAGDLQSVIYSDATAGITNTYDRLGRESVVTNGATTTGFAYDGGNDILSEAYSGGALSGLSITNGYDSLLRRAAVGLSSQPSTLVQFGYDLASRLGTVTNGNGTVAYSYLANSSLIQTPTFKQSGTVRLTATKSYDNLNRLTFISSTNSQFQPPFSFTYTFNAANQRMAVTNADNSVWSFQYDSLGQVTSGKKYWSDGTPVAGQQFTYGFDDIGNRTNTTSGGDEYGANLRSAIYGVNNLNQYTNRTVPGYINILGSANSNATVTIWGASNLYARASRKGDYFRGEVAMSNTTTAIWESLTNLAVLNNGTNADIIATNIGSKFVAQTPEAFAYDLDGNLTNNGHWTFGWDGENRLTNITALSTLPTAAKEKVDCTYDYLGRRIQKIVSTNSGSGYVPQNTNKFVYDGWNLAAVLGTNNALLYSFVWGADLSGTVQKTGGIGGLISMTVYQGTDAGTYFYCFDGNGNVVALVNATNGNVAAKYEYDPFLNVLRATGPLAKINPFLGATKFYDWETGLYNFGYRYYDPATGRWLNRDPLQEQGGLNLYVFANNAPVNYADVDGRFVAGLDELFNFGFLAFDITTGAGAATIAMDVAAIAIPYVPNPKLLEFIKPQIIKKLINGVEKEFEITKTTSLTRAAFIDKDLAAQNNKLKLTMEYLGRRTEGAGAKHFKGFSWTEGEIAQATRNRGSVSLWMPRMDDDWVQVQINEALKSYLAEHPHPSADTLNGYIYDIALPGADKDPLLAAFSKAGYSEGRCTSRIQLRVDQNGHIHAYPVR